MLFGQSIKVEIKETPNAGSYSSCCTANKINDYYPWCTQELVLCVIATIMTYKTMMLTSYTIV